MRNFYTLLSDNEAVIWIMEYAKKSKMEALKIVHGFRKSHRAVGVADRMKIHAEVLPGCTFKRDLPQIGPVSEDFTLFGGFNFPDPETDHCLVSWLPVPLADSVGKNVPEQKAVIDMFKAESGLPDWCEVSFGSINHIAGMALAHLKATNMHPFNDLIVNTDSYDTFHYRLRLKWIDGQIYCSFCPWDEDRFSRVAIFAIGVIKALPMDELIPEGYEIIETVQSSEFEMKDLEYVSFVEKGQSPVWGKTMRQRALVDFKASFGLPDAKRILVRSAEIPNEYRNKSILFPGTRLLSSSGAQIIPRIFRQDDGSWHLGSLTITSFWQPDDILVRCKQNTEENKGETP